MIKAIATDLDGTLFYPKNKRKLIYPGNVNCIKHFLNEGKELILVTGRNYSIAKKVEKAIGMESSLNFVGCNGAIVVSKGEVIAEHYLEKEKITPLLEDLYNNPDVRLIFFMGSFDGMIIETVNMGKLTTAIGKIGFRLQGAYYEKTRYGSRKVSKLFEDENAKFYKVMPVFALGNTSLKGIEKANKYRRELLAKYGDDFEISTSTTAIEITAKGVTKANSLKFLLDHIGTKHDEVAVVGDSGNDVPMFEEFEESFVMKHATKPIRRKAKHEIFVWHDLRKYIK